MKKLQISKYKTKINLQRQEIIHAGLDNNYLNQSNLDVSLLLNVNKDNLILVLAILQSGADDLPNDNQGCVDRGKCFLVVKGRRKLQQN